MDMDSWDCIYSILRIEINRLESIWNVYSRLQEEQSKIYANFYSQTLRHRNSEKRTDTEKLITDPWSAYLTLTESIVRSHATKLTYKFVAQCNHSDNINFFEIFSSIC